ncbi:MAG: hypothetical protein JRI55_19935 [Deltaproteobacteria bacterium]|jgi:hypothetical protein|nr:hypothetical protein [Deltaproteobacteria bacterium]
MWMTLCSAAVFGCRRRTPPSQVLGSADCECPEAPPAEPLDFSFDPLLEFPITSEPMKKSGGKRDGQDWVCTKETCEPGIVVYGPYTEEVPTGRRLVRLWLRAENFQKPSEEFVGLEVWDAAAEKRLALQGISAKDAARTDGTAAALVVPFEAPLEGKLEFRVAWAGDGLLRLRSLQVY